MYGHIRSCADGETDLCRGQCRCVVDAVADHADVTALLLQGFDLPHLVLRQHFGFKARDAGFPGNVLRGAPVVAGEHDDFDAQSLQSCYGCC